ncbi:hypothetical protein ACN28S_32015 [Cystobacter fuscus]
MLIWAGEFCLRTYWINGIRSLRYRNAPEQERMQKLLQAGILVPDDVNPRTGQLPSQVRFFHDSMQSYLTARGLFLREHAADAWDILWRTAADPLFTSAQSEFSSGAGSELFQMCLQVFGPEEKLRRELTRQLLEWALLYDDMLTKRAILDALPEEAAALPVESPLQYGAASRRPPASGNRGVRSESSQPRLSLRSHRPTGLAAEGTGAHGLRACGTGAHRLLNVEVCPSSRDVLEVVNTERGLR